MADAVVKMKAAAAVIPNAGAEAQPSNTTTSSAPAEAKSVIDVFALCSSPSTLSAEGTAYIDKIVSTISASGREVKPIKLVGANYEARAIEFNNTIVAFVFAETYTPGVSTLPVAGVWLSDFPTVLRTAGLDPNKVAEFIVVTKEDYAKVDIMASRIVNMYMAKDTRAIKELSARQFQAGQYRITTDMTVIRAFVEKLHPLAVLPRMDVGMMLYATKTIENKLDINGRPEVQTVPILAATGYTDFSYSTANDPYGQAQTAYAPIFTLTGVFSKIVNPQIVDIGVLLGSYMFVYQANWLGQFNSFAKGSPDLGNLLQDNKGNPCTATDANQRKDFINKFLNPKLPYFSVDLQLGQPALPGLRDIIHNQGLFNAAVDEFTGGKGARTAQTPMQTIITRFDGRVRLNKAGRGDFADTREIDYMHLVRSGVKPADVAQNFLNVAQNPSERYEATKRYYPDQELLYITNRIILNPNWLNLAAQDLGQVLHFTLESGFAPNMLDVSTLAPFTPMGAGMMPGFMAATGGVGQWGNGYFF